MSSENKFTYADMIGDLKDNSRRIVKGGYLCVKGVRDVVVNISDSSAVNARVAATAPDQYTITICEGFLKSCYQLIDGVVRSYYSLIMSDSRFTEELFVRTVCGCATEMMFWHEFSHMARGHFPYLASRGVSLRSDSSAQRTEDETQELRLVEMDADIYAASFLYARLYSVYLGSRGNSDIPLRDLMRCYSLGIRAFFEAMYTAGYFEDEIHSQSDHPHSLARAYASIAFGLTGAVSDKVGADSALCREVAVKELLMFERGQRFSSVDVEILHQYVSVDWRAWGERSEEINKFSLLEVKKVPLRTRLVDYLNRIMN